MVVNHPPTHKSGTREERQRFSDHRMILARRDGLAIAKIIALRIDYYGVREHHIHFRAPIEKRRDLRKGAWKVLFVAIDVSQQLTRGAFESSVHGVVHPAVLFNERFDARI